MQHRAFTDDEIMAVLLGEAPDEVASALAAASGADASLKARLTRMGRALEAMDRARSVEPLFQVERERLDELAARTAPAPGPLAELGASVRRLLGALVADSRREPQTLAGFRASEAERRLVFEADGVEIRLHVTPKRPAIEGVGVGEVMVVGQITGLGPGLTVSATDSNGRETRVSVDDEGFFELGLAPALCSLEIAAAGVSIAIPEVDLTA